MPFARGSDTPLKLNAIRPRQRPAERSSPAAASYAVLQVSAVLMHARHAKWNSFQEGDNLNARGSDTPSLL